MDERECSVCAAPIDELEQGTEEEEAAYAAGLCLTDYENAEEDRAAETSGESDGDPDAIGAERS